MREFRSIAGGPEDAGEADECTPRWLFGEGTHNPEGDFYFGNKYEEASEFSLEHIEDSIKLGESGWYEVCIDPDLIVDEGL